MVVLRSTCPDVVMLLTVDFAAATDNTDTAPDSGDEHSDAPELSTPDALRNTLTPESWTRVLSPGPPKHSESWPHSR